MSPRCDRGVVFAEFLVAFPILFVMFLGVIQLAFAGVASLVVHHAAYRAAREAAIVLDEDPDHLDGAPRMALRVDGKANGKKVSRGPRMKRVHDAAESALRALAPSSLALKGAASGQTPALAKGALDDSAASRALGTLVYTGLATELSVGDSPGAGSHHFDSNAPVRVKVAYTYVCNVPIADALLCDPAIDVPGVERIEKLTGFQLPRLLALEAEAEAAIHAAPYKYRSEHDEV